MKSRYQENSEATTGQGKRARSKWRETLEAILIAVGVALFLRAFIVEAFKIPSSSMVPNLKIGDHIFVNKYIYGLRVPLTLKQLVSFKKPKRGEIIVFNFPNDTSKDYIKRVIGLPGDRIRIQDKDVSVNGELLHRTELTGSDDRKILEDIPDKENYAIFTEQSADRIKYFVIYRKYRYPEYSRDDGSDLIVPMDKYLVMGDNRDNSSDSRIWGFVPAEFIKGRALFTWLSLNNETPIFWKIPGVRWERFGQLIK